MKGPYTRHRDARAHAEQRRAAKAGWREGTGKAWNPPMTDEDFARITRPSSHVMDAMKYAMQGWGPRKSDNAYARTAIDRLVAQERTREGVFNVAVEHGRRMADAELRASMSPEDYAEWKKIEAEDEAKHREAIDLAGKHREG